MQVIFENDKEIQTHQETTLLELALENKIPIAHACGGNAKCSTCRVIVLSGIENLTPPTEKEEAIAKLKGLERNIRLACQTKVRGSVKVKRLVRDKEDIEQAISLGGISTGREMHI
ncbi:MAG: (2Fe-2S)-binding protein, partial [Leptospiraceae bacterium]|nr:(2Fe-2S)-binding protein [Leptospiraceae bacterium]